MNTAELDVKGITCGSCAARIRDALSRISSVDSVAVDVGRGRATVQSSGEDPTADELVAALAAIGYSAQLVAPASAKASAGLVNAASGTCGTAKAASRHSGCCRGG